MKATRSITTFWRDGNEVDGYVKKKSVEIIEGEEDENGNFTCLRGGVLTTFEKPPFEGLPPIKET